MTKQYISKYITYDEFCCPHCHKLPMDMDLNDLLYIYLDFFESFKIVREELGEPIKWNSGYRCREYNRIIGGSPLSAHMFGCAGDWECATVNDVDKLSAIMESLVPNLRRIEYRKSATFIHADNSYLIRPRASESWIQEWRDYA